jgi:hypothetical protein
VKVSSAESNIIVEKDKVPQTTDAGKKTKLKAGRRLSEFVFREVENKAEKEKRTSQGKSGSHRLSELHRFQTYHKF